MTDRELLELAAKAAGLKVVDRLSATLYIASEGCCGGARWNPLDDDGDAFRLAVKLQMIVNIDPTESQAGDGRRDDECELHRGSDPYAATRRAIVRAAAEVVRK